MLNICPIFNRKSDDDISLIQDNLLVASQHGKANDAGRCCTALCVSSERGPLSTGRDIAQDFLQRVDLHSNLRSQIELLEIDLLMKSGEHLSVLSKLQNIDKRLPKIISDASESSPQHSPSPFRNLTGTVVPNNLDEQRLQSVQCLQAATG